MKKTCLSKDCPERAGGECDAKEPLFRISDIKAAAEYSNMVQRELYYSAIDAEKAELREVVNFLIESNAIEGETSLEALNDSLAAWDAMMDCGVKNEDDIADYHNLIMKNIKPRVAGHFRKCNVRVSDRACPPWQDVEDLVIIWTVEHLSAKTEKEIKEAHVEFEKIHPFEDGNGRIGRMIMNWQRKKAGLPLLTIHSGDEQLDYYKWFK